MKKFFFIEILTALAITALTACSPKPEAIDFTVDKCEHCKMNIADAKFAAELVTKRGKVYKFDAIECLSAFLTDKTKIEESAVHSLWVMNYTQPGVLIDAQKALYAQNEEIRSPMSLNVAACANETELRQILARFPGKRMEWKDVLARIQTLRAE